MLVVFTVLFFVLREIFAYQQDGYKILTEHADVARYDEKYAFLKINSFKYNRTYIALNLTLDLKLDFGNHIRVEVEGFKFQSNEYRQFPLIFGENVCEALAKNDFGMENLFDCGNLTRCLLKKGRYLICNWGPDYPKFPPHIPAGQYRINVKLMYFSHEIAALEWFMKIQNMGLF